MPGKDHVIGNEELVPVHVLILVNAGNFWPSSLMTTDAPTVLP
jgi:hypothetical protein